MTLVQLQYALELYKHKSFKVAASHLSITQPALSLQINKLENEIGIRLFDRKKTSVEATSEGAEFILRAQEVVLNAARLKDFASEVVEAPMGKLRIGIIPTLSPFLVPLFVNSFRDQYPNISLDIDEETTERVIKGIRDGSIDAGIISTPFQASDLEIIPLFYEKFFFYSSAIQPSAEVSLKSIDYSRLWLLNEGNCFRDQVNNFCDLRKIRENKKLVYRSNSIDALIRVVDSQGGMTILPELTTLILHENQEDKIRPIDKKRPKAREISLLCRNHYNRKPILRRLTEVIKTNVPKSLLSKTNLEIVDPNIQID